MSSTIKRYSLILVSRIMEIWADPIQKLTHSLWMRHCPIWLWYKSLKERKRHNIFHLNYITHVAAVWVIVNRYRAASSASAIMYRVRTVEMLRWKIDASRYILADTWLPQHWEALLSLNNSSNGSNPAVNMLMKAYKMARFLGEWS